MAKALVEAVATEVEVIAVIITMAIITKVVLVFLNNYHSCNVLEATMEVEHFMGSVQFCWFYSLVFSQILQTLLNQLYPIARCR